MPIGHRSNDTHIQTWVDARLLAMAKLYLEKKYGEDLRKASALARACIDELAILANRAGIPTIETTHQAHQLLESAGYTGRNPLGRLKQTLVHNMQQDERENEPPTHAVGVPLPLPEETLAPPVPYVPTDEEREALRLFKVEQAEEHRVNERMRQRQQLRKELRTVTTDEQGIATLGPQAPRAPLTPEEEELRNEYVVRGRDLMQRIRAPHTQKEDLQLEDERIQWLKEGYYHGYTTP